VTDIQKLDEALQAFHVQAEELTNLAAKLRQFDLESGNTPLGLVCEMGKAAPLLMNACNALLAANMLVAKIGGVK
jgi:hypothetical protein